MRQSDSRHLWKSYPLRLNAVLIFLFIIILPSCQKKLKINTDIGEIKQVIIANLYPNSHLDIYISKSKQPDDYNPVEFLSDCKVDLYEEGIFKETMTFRLKDTLSGLGYYTSSFRLKENKSYSIVSSHPFLGTAQATEFLPPHPNITNISLLAHADSLHPSSLGQYTVSIQDSSETKNYYFIAVFYRVLKSKIDSTGDTTYVKDYIWNIPSYSPEFTNPSNSNRIYFKDDGFNGSIKTLPFSFPSQYKSIYKEITFIIEVANIGRNFYEWNVQQLRYETNFLNEGQYERNNIKSNIINGYGHFSAKSSSYFEYKIR